MHRALTRVGTLLTPACFLFASWSVAAPKKAAALDPFTGYLMVHFTGESGTARRAPDRPVPVRGALPPRRRGPRSLTGNSPLVRTGQ
jgi:hypothetical protein